MIHPSQRRPGFTLIELITVIGIMLVISAMIVGVAYTGNNKQVTANGSSALVGWLKTAQAYALRDQKPYGLRLRQDATGLVTSFQYIEQPFDWVGPVGSTVSSTATGNAITITGTGVDFTGGGTSPIQAGDFFECNGGQICVITGVSGATTITAQMQPGDTTGMWTFTGSSDFRIVRQPQAMIGADMLALPSGVAVNTTANTTFPSALPPTDAQGNINILFAPNGSVITPGLSGRDIRLWVVDTNQPGFSASASTFTGTPLIVTVAIRTGLISVQSVGPSGSEYKFVQDGKSSGY
jgi:prepilin-type N-terminal cleavage/methylation domain-containing protein